MRVAKGEVGAALPLSEARGPRLQRPSSLTCPWLLAPGLRAEREVTTFAFALAPLPFLTSRFPCPHTPCKRPGNVQKPLLKQNPGLCPPHHKPLLSSASYEDNQLVQNECGCRTGCP